MGDHRYLTHPRVISSSEHSAAVIENTDRDEGDERKAGEVKECRQQQQLLCLSQLIIIVCSCSNIISLNYLGEVCTTRSE